MNYFPTNDLRQAYGSHFQPFFSHSHVDSNTKSHDFIVSLLHAAASPLLSISELLIPS